MKNLRTIVIVILAVLIVGEGAYLYLSNKAGEESAPASPQAATTTATLDSLSSAPAAGSVRTQGGSAPQPAPILNSLATTSPKSSGSSGSSSGANMQLLDSLKAK